LYTFETLHFKVNIVIVTDVCPEERLDALQAAILLLPDENREVLQCLLSFLADMALSAAENQVNYTLDNAYVAFYMHLFQQGCVSINKSEVPWQ
jgi:hypothetical protein